MNKNLMYLREQWKKYRRKYLISQTIFITINLIIIFSTSALLILNLYTIKYNDVYLNVKPFFVALTVISGFSTFMVAISSFLNFKNKKNEYENQIKEIEALLEAKNQEDIIKHLDELKKQFKK